MNDASAASEVLSVRRPMTETNFRKKGRDESTSEAGERSDPLRVPVPERPDDQDESPHWYDTSAGRRSGAPFAAKRRSMRVLVTNMYEGSGERSDPPSLCIFIVNS